MEWGVKADYKFLNISKEILENYLNYISGNGINDNINIEKGNENNYCLNKDLLNYANAIVDLKIEGNNKNHNINLNNSSLSSGNNNDINGNWIEFSIEKLSALDANIIVSLVQNLNTYFIKLGKNIGIFNDRFTSWRYYWIKKILKLLSEVTN